MCLSLKKKSFCIAICPFRPFYGSKLEKYIKIFLYKTETKSLFFKEFFNTALAKSFFFSGKWIIKKVFRKIKKFIEDPESFLDKKVINEFLKYEYLKKKLKVVKHTKKKTKKL